MTAGKNLVKGLVVFLVLATPTLLTSLLAQKPAWQRKAAAPQGCVFPNMPPQVIGDKIYCLAGRDYVLDKMMIYNPAADAWESKETHLITNRHHFATAVWDGKLYIAGGCVGDDSTEHKRISAVEVYDPTSNAWSVRANMQVPRHGFQLVVYENIIYAIGGTDKEDAPIREIEVYDPVHDEWRIKTSAPWTSSLHCSGAVVYKQNIFLLGENQDGPAFIAYDPGSDTFTAKEPMGEFQRGAYAVVLAGHLIFTIGGGGELPVAAVAAFDLVKNVWIKYPDLPEARAFPGVIFMNGKIYCLGGVGPQWDWSKPTTTVFEYDLSAGILQ